jgi:phospholipid transport system substrate-binding protein
MKWLCVLLLGAAIGCPAQAEELLAPDVLIKNVTNEVIEIVRKDKDIQSGNHKKAVELIEAKVLPNFNFPRMTALAVARDWRSATPAQQKALTDEFHTLLVRTYSSALTEYKSQTVEYKPFKMNAGDTDVKVRTQINQGGGAKPISLDYYLQKDTAGWKVYDIEVGGISLVTNYREFFAGEIRKGGIDGLIKTLQSKNRSAADAGVSASAK